jgi:hypothetical protein
VSWSKTLQIIAVDAIGKSQTLIIPIVITTKDDDKPILDLSSIKVVSNAWWSWYTVKFNFIDKTSWVWGSSIRLSDGDKHTFKWSSVSMILPQLWSINYSAVDLFNNQVDGTINLNDYLSKL